MKLLFIIFIVISIIVIITLIKLNSDLKFEIEQKRQEIEASSKYIELLTDKLVQNSPQSHGSERKSEKLRQLLKDYIGNQDDTSAQHYDKLKETERKKTFIPDLIPVIGQFVISQRFKENHLAIDLAASMGSQVVTSATGEIVLVKEDKYFGNMVIIDHFNGFVTSYAHLAKVLVEEGDIVKKGMNIGLVGNTGNSTGPHLHFEILDNGSAIDPEKFILFDE